MSFDNTSSIFEAIKLRETKTFQTVIVEQSDQNPLTYPVTELNKSLHVCELISNNF